MAMVIEGLYILWAIAILTITPAPAANAIAIDLSSGTKDDYSKALVDLRNEVKGKNLVSCTVPTIPKASDPPKYTFVDLEAAGKTMTLAINKNNIYVVGYRDQFDGKYRAHFFPDAPSNAKKELFPEAKGKDRLTINYKSSYVNGGLESKAGSRKDVGLGIKKLAEYLQNAYGKKINDKDEAKFLMVAVQMVSEAARFKYIENEVIKHFNDDKNGFTPDDKILMLENGWGKISAAMHKSEKEKDTKKKCIVFDPAVVLDYPDASGKKWTISKVEEVLPDLGILGNEGKTITLLNLHSFLDNSFASTIINRFPALN